MLSLTVHDLGDVAVVECAGRITAEDGDALRNAVARLRDSHLPELVLDLKEVRDVDAAGLGVLVTLRAWAQTSGMELKLMNLMPRVERVLELTRLKPKFAVCSAREMLGLWCRAAHRDQPAKRAAGF